MNSPELVSTILGEIQGVLDTFDYASLDIVAGELNAARHVVVAGEGRSGFMAKAFAMRLMHLGVPVHVVGETTTPAWAARICSSRCPGRAPPRAPCGRPSRPTRSGGG